jgi:hypothetical protein
MKFLCPDTSHKISLEQMGPVPFSLVVAKSMLHNRSSTPPVASITESSESLAVPENIGSYPLPHVLRPDEANMIIQEHRSNDDSDEKEDDDNDDDEVVGLQFDMTELAHTNEKFQQSDTSELSVPSTSKSSTISSTSTSLPDDADIPARSVSSQFRRKDWEKRLSEGSSSYPSLKQPSQSWKAFLTRIFSMLKTTYCVLFLRIILLTKHLHLLLVKLYLFMIRMIMLQLRQNSKSII